MSIARTFASLVVSAVLISACETAPQRAVEPDSEATRVARTHMQSGEYLPAAQEFLRLAELSAGDAAMRYRLEAASAFVLAKRPDAARRILAESGAPTPSRDLQVRRNLVEAQLALVDERTDEALRLLAAAPREDAPPDLVARYRSVRADALEAAGEHLASARERVQLELLVTDGAALNENRRRIWQSLTQLSPEALEAAHIPPPSTLGGWIELAAIGSATLTDPVALSQAVALWRHRYPGHPAGESVVPMLMDDGHFAWSPARSVALLLPFEGQFGKAAEAVRDGFMAAWFADPDVQNRPAVIVRDTSSGDVRSVYDQVVEEGADFVVGPLRRASVARLAESAALPVPTLTLNHADTDNGTDSERSAAMPTTGLFQFALSPESEAKLVAEYAWFADHSNAAVLAPAGAWGERVAGAFAQAWEKLGGRVVEVQTYLNDGSDMSTPVRKLLDIDGSESRYRSLRQVLGVDIKKEARRRRDVDFVFMAAFPVQARQLRPQLEFHQAQDLPVYATSHVYSGIADATADRDVEGVVFGDMPWVLDPAARSAELRRNVETLWGDSFKAFVRLYAFGVDGYHLVKELGRLRAQHYTEFQGATGKLSLNEQNKIDRQLSWARFVRGRPRLLTGEPQPTR
ncbi:MAG: ABC transporter substrate-binding protein [Gammaproteobacteria bacterium]|nr:ABC transporter substrate-binding protein [Gammaproteobacteria bacterium]NIM74895.1 ABC transporter substrate-binding protein [Gammaproteobacteria bacterium]NIO26812.1 ABC transporter substrate-binding protein [Gammaproteobacteria bacterium]NIP65684.1 ABC transporter substrate-binding protein [Gammaproteobacteria bacterium]NIQ28665.1 ABC transporter substrate-binding protein [Gammaproteobacteria bacterium]